ncbi:hypothetical protein [Clostridium intestinale]|uniref:Uncharacterized protein n=1 Tax=Clostridium intestinale URNW TaxID=1294142 RepID=U2NPC3_9CLOT|nr:hypothetical protein [Clostridium intestinale]ERK30696.1 hypothetical protein CINTURNW_2001 [Clostridium intestinale URNW]
MKNSTILLVILSIVAVIGGMVLNFQEFLMGSPANFKNLIVTFLYLLIWIFILFISIRFKNRSVLRYCLVFGVVMLVLSLLTIYINVSGATANWALIFVILLLGQWYGINFFTGSFLISSIILVFISLLISIITFMSLKRLK